MFQKDTNIAILGDGGWGTALALSLACQGFSPVLWGAFPQYVRETSQKRENSKFLPGFKIPQNVRFEADLAAACASAEYLVLAVPSQYVRSVAAKLKKENLRGKKIVAVAKGIETGSLKVMSQVIAEELGSVDLCVLSGPSIAREVALKMPLAVSAASENKKLTAEVRQIFSTDYFGVFESDDMLGVEIGGAVKNVIAIASGIMEGCGYGSNARAALFARGVAEMARLGVKMGAKRETFMGLSGVGDLATTCFSPHSRNRTLGECIGKGEPLEKILKKSEMVVEGVETSRSTVELAKKHKVSMPICEAVHTILFHGGKPVEVVRAIMNDRTHQEKD